jgi:hypothetical protein
MSLAGRKVLIDSSLDSGLIHFMSLCTFHKTVNFKFDEKTEKFILARWKF